MWHEARKHERKLRGMMVDYKKRAERRREYYEKIKKDPAQFLQVHGRACKVHLDSAVALAAESPVNMMPWQGDTNNMIDRFDVRAHLDYIPMYTPPLLNPISPEQESDERKCNYERYRGLVQNDFAGISEEQCLYQIYIDELYGGLQKPNEDEKKKLAEKKASIGYTYEDSTVAELENSLEKRGDEEDSEEDSNTDEDEVIPDIDVEVDVDELNQEQVADLNKQATTYGMAEGDFVRMLRKDKEEAEAIKHAKALEEEKAMYSVRCSPGEGCPSQASFQPCSDLSVFPKPGKAPFPMGQRHSSSSSSSPSSSSSSSSRSSSRSHRASGHHHQSSRYRRSHSRRYSRSRSRSRRYSGGGSRDGRRRSRSHSADRGRRYSSRRRSRSHSRSGERYRRSGRAGRHWSSSRSSRSPSDSRSRIHSVLPKLTPQEKLKLRMQKALNRQFKADKKAAQEKMMQQEHERQEREDELRAMARKIRMKERERREKEREEWERQYSRQSRSPSPRYSEYLLLGTALANDSCAVREWGQAQTAGQGV
uniref:CLK4 associating serine/arginine rich protein n=1 Tax=Chelonoidis abingdonii TaxID=106734 RepID=A0A8C0IP79_CHEAB